MYYKMWAQHIYNEAIKEAVDLIKINMKDEPYELGLYEVEQCLLLITFRNMYRYPEKKRWYGEKEIPVEFTPNIDEETMERKIKEYQEKKRKKYIIEVDFRNEYIIGTDSLAKEGAKKEILMMVQKGFAKDHLSLQMLDFRVRQKEGESHA